MVGPSFKEKGMKIKIGMDNFTGNFGGTEFVHSEAEVPEIPPRLKRACMVTGYTLEEVVAKKRRPTRAKAGKKK